MEYIKFKISQSSTTENNGYEMAVVKGIESNIENDRLDYQYCMGDIIRHALSRATSVDVDDERFTYTFPFTL